MGNRDLDDFYSAGYSEVFDRGCIGFAGVWAHKSLEAPFKRHHSFPLTLELGAGAGQHLSFVKHHFERYVESDIREGPLRMGRSSPGIERMIIDASDLTVMDDNSVDRIIATCLLAHLPEPEIALAEWRRVLKPGGVLSLYVPADPGVVLGVAQTFTTARKTNELGFDYWGIHLREHRFHFPYLRRVLQDTFDSDRVSFRSFPAPGLSWQMALWFTVQIVRQRERVEH